MVNNWIFNRRGVAVLLAVAVLAACQSMQRAQPIDSMEIVMTDEGCAPLDARVEAGSTLTVKIENRSETSQMIRLLIYPLTIAPDPDRSENIYWQARVQPGFSVIEELAAPRMPGNYDLVCGRAEALDQSQGELTVVRP